MKQYRFALEVVLRVRRAQEEAAAFALAAAHQNRQQALEALGAASARCDALVLERAAQDHASFHRERDMSDRRAAAVTAALAAVDTASAEAAARHADWSAAATVVAAVERLDERRREEWRAEVQRAETAAIDESALVGWLAEATAPTRADIGVSA
jgi:flagellar export protein FliJ